MSSERETTDVVMAAIGAAQQLALEGERETARRQLAVLWDQVGSDGDPLHRVSLAHYMADVQDDPEQELAWDVRALAAADALTDERAQAHDATLVVRGFYPSLHLNLGADYEKLGRLQEARDHLVRAERAAADLPGDDYSTLIRSGISALRQRLDG